VIWSSFHWLEAEMMAIKPQVPVFLGATAAQSVLGNALRVTKMRGVWIDSDVAEHVLATVYPSSILRAPDSDSCQQQ
jgi:DNA polymerase